MGRSGGALFRLQDLATGAPRDDFFQVPEFVSVSKRPLPAVSGGDNCRVPEPPWKRAAVMVKIMAWNWFSFSSFLG